MALAVASNIGPAVAAIALFAILAPAADWAQWPLLSGLAAISTIAYLAEVRLKIEPAGYFDASLAFALLALGVGGPLPALAVWVLPDAVGRYIVRPYDDPVPRYRLSPGLVATWSSFALAALAASGVLANVPPGSHAAIAPSLFSAGLALVTVNFAVARLGFAPFYQRFRVLPLVRDEFVRLLPLVLVLLALATVTWLLIPLAGVLAMAPLALAVIAPQLAFARLSRRRSVARIARLDAEKLYASAIADMLGMSRADRRVLECASEVAAQRHRRWRFEDAMRYSLADVSAAIPVALHADERWDGGGEPAHLEGHQAPLGSRILAVARKWSELTARGTPTLPHVEAMLGLAALSGSELDPTVVRAAQRVVAQEEIFIGARDFEPRLHRLPLPRAARRGAVPALLGKIAAAQ